MTEHPSLALAVIMERRTVTSGRWESRRWEVVGVIPDPGGEPRMLVEEPARVQWLHPGFPVTLFRDEAEGYYLNLSTAKPYVFVMWREEDDAGVPMLVTVSYNEAGRLMDGGERVEGVPMPGDIASWVAAFTDAHYQPEPKRRSRPPSFKGARRDDPGGKGP